MVFLASFPTTDWLNIYTIFLKLIYSEKATEFCEISTLLLTGTTQDKSKVEISQNFVAFSEYMNFKKISLLSSLLLAVKFCLFDYRVIQGKV